MINFSINKSASVLEIKISKISGQNFHPNFIHRKLIKINSSYPSFRSNYRSDYCFIKQKYFTNFGQNFPKFLDTILTQFVLHNFQI